jgi:hypothetical protein
MSNLPNSSITVDHHLFANSIGVPITKFTYWCKRQVLPSRPGRLPLGRYITMYQLDEPTGRKAAAHFGKHFPEQLYHEAPTTLTAPPTPAELEQDGLLSGLDVREIDGELRVRDVDLARNLLEMAQPLNIRQTIKANIEEIQGLGTVHALREPSTSGNGTSQDSTIYWLNEEQALLLTVLSRTPKGREARAVLIKTFVAYRRGDLKLRLVSKGWVELNGKQVELLRISGEDYFDIDQLHSALNRKWLSNQYTLLALHMGSHIYEHDKRKLISPDSLRRCMLMTEFRRVIPEIKQVLTLVSPLVIEG